MKKIIIALLMALPFTAMAADLKIGVFNSQEVITIMPEYNAAMSELENMNLKFQTEGKKLQEEFSKNGYQYYIEEGWIKGYKWPRDLDVGTIPIAGDKEKLHLLMLTKNTTRPISFHTSRLS